ncbi:hypothetical protein DVJ78_15415 [Humibacter sp. BT305]|nr:hypothetical protein DVJ78_15415 [Humibacter sp. BT305]
MSPSLDDFEHTTTVRMGMDWGPGSAGGNNLASAGDALDPTSTDTTRAAHGSAADQPLTRRERREREARTTAGSDRGNAIVLSSTATAVVRSAAATTAAASAHRAPVAAATPSVPVAKEPIAASSAVVPAAFSARQQRARLRLPRKRTVAAGFVMALAAGMFATTALPAYAYGGGGSFDPEATSTAFGEDQTLQIPNATAILTVSRDGYTAPTPEELAAAEQAAQAAAQAALDAERAAAATPATSGSSASRSPFAVTPPSSAYSGAAVVAYAQQFVGVVPYGTGNSPDTSFSCDGLTQYVMGAFGISLPRGVSAQAALMVQIDPADAQPGDFLVYPGQHIGIYAGGGMMIDSPDWGRYVEYRGIWGSPYYARYVG